jgi:alpha-tubulin suppressor-like RCC1 family protein
MRSEGTIGALAALLAVIACGTDDRILTDNVVDPRALAALTKFRSCCGHSFAGWGESNRSMKHYLVPAASFMGTNDSLPVYAPCDGEIVSIRAEQSYTGCSGNEVRGSNVRFVCRARPDVSVRIFHVNPSRGPGAVRSGARVGYADLRGCASGPEDVPYADFDVAVEKLGAFYSYIEWLDDGAFAPWAALGLASRDDAVVSRAARDADPCDFADYLQCEADTILLPVEPPVSSSPSAIAAGGAHTCAVVDGGARCWGDNFAGQVGNGTTTQARAPVEVVGLTAGVQAIAPGGAHTCALVNGRAMCWGDNTHGELGDGSSTSSSVPVEVSGLTSGVDAIAAGSGYACALVNGGVQCWGDNSRGQLGNGSSTSSSVPVAVVSLGSDVQAVAAGRLHACAVVNGGVRCWGYNLNGQLGDGSTADRDVPGQVAGLPTGVEAIAAGGDHTCAVVNGGVQCWGDNSWGQLGNDSTAGSAVPVPVIGLASGVQAIAAGGLHTCALVNGGVQCWGRGYDGQLGDGTTTDSHTPIQVFDLTSGATAVTAGQDHTCAIVNGGAECWGAAGRLGNRTQTGSTVPVGVVGLAP